MSKKLNGKLRQLLLARAAAAGGGGEAADGLGNGRGGQGGRGGRARKGKRGSAQSWAEARSGGRLHGPG